MSFPNMLQFAPFGAVRCRKREYMVVVCESDPAAIRAALPLPLEPDGSNTVRIRFIATPDPGGAGSYVETDLVIPAQFGGAHVDFTAQRYADAEIPALAAAGDCAAWPRRPGRTRLLFMRATAAAVLEVGGHAAVLAEMGHGRYGLLNGATCTGTAGAVRRLLAPVQVNLKRVPAANGRAAIAQLVGCGIENLRVHAAWSGAARMHRNPSCRAPIGGFPLERVIGGFNFVCDVTLARPQVLFDYRREARRPIRSLLADLAADLALPLAEAA
jgi:acetoacetate decarboxylase